MAEQDTDEQDTPRLDVELFERDRIEYRRVEDRANVYEYNRLSDTSSVRFTDGGIADGYITLHADGTPATPATSYVVLDQYIKRDERFLGEMPRTPLSERDYGFYSAAAEALRDLQRVSVSPDGRNVIVISGGRRVEVELVLPYIVVDRSYREFFSFVDVRAGMRLFADMELKVDFKDRSVILVDRRGSASVLADLPYMRVRDLDSGEMFEAREGAPDRAVASLSPLSPLSSLVGARVVPKTSSIRQQVEPAVRASTVATPLPPSASVHQAARGDGSDATAHAVLPEERGLARAKPLGKGAAVAEGAQTKTSFLRLVTPLAAGANPASSSAKSGLGRESRATGTVAPGIEREGAPRLISETRREASTERIYELPQSKVRLALSYQNDGPVVVVSVVAGMSLYPGNAVLSDWEQRIIRAREHWKKFRYDDVEQDIAAAKRIVVARARELLAYAAAVAAFSPGSLEAHALEEARLKLKRDTEARYGNVFK